MKRIERVLATCVDDIEAGKATIEECLERYRELSAELEPLLRLALEIEKLPSVSPSKVFKARARANVVEYAYDHPARRSRWQWLTNNLVQPGWARAGVIALAILVVLAGSGTGTAYAAQSSLPGDLLYPVKIATESWREWIESDAAEDTSLQLEFAGRRIEEMERIVEKSSPDINIAVAGYENNIDKALIYLNEAPADNLPEDVAMAISEQLNRIELIEDVSGGASQPGITEAEQIAVNGHMRSLRYLSETRSVRASELIIAAMQNHLELAAAGIANGNTVRAENALRYFNGYASLGEETRDDYAGTEAETSLDALFRQAANQQQQFFTMFSGQVSPQIANEVQMAFQRMEQNRGQETGNAGQGPGNQEPEPVNEEPEPASGGQEPGNQEPGAGSEEQEPGNQGQEPGNQGQEPGNQGQDTGSGGGNNPGIQSGK